MNSPLFRAQSRLEALLNWRYLSALSAVLFFLIIGLASLLAYQHARVVYDQISSDFNQQQLILARQAASQINLLLNDVGVEIASLKRFLPGKPDEARAEAMPAMFERTRGKGLFLIGLLDPAGRLVAAYPAASADGLKPDQVPADCRFDPTGRMILGPLRVENSESPKVTGTLCTRVGFGDHREGVLFVRLDVTRLVAGVTSPIRSGRTGYAWIIDETGLFLYHPEAEFIGKNAFSARKEREPYLSFTAINQIMKDRMEKGEEGTGLYESGWHRGIKGRIIKLIAFTPVKSPALPRGRVWSVAVAAPVSEVSAAVHRLYVRHFAAEATIIAGLFVFGLLAVIYQRRISQALKERVKQTEADLHETELIYQRVVEQATDLIYILDLELRVVLLNRHCLETFSDLVITRAEGGVLPEDADLTQAETFVGRRLEEFFRPADVAFVRKQTARVLEGQRSISYEHTLTLKGRMANLSTKLIPIRDNAGRISQFLAISRDVTEKMEMEQRIYHTEKLASIGTLAAGVAHEINNPLAIILGFTDLLLDRFGPESPAREDLRVIEYNANHAKKVVETLLGFARITEGMADVVDIVQSANTVMSVVKNTLMTKKIELRLSLPERLPRVKGDPREFQQVLFNLINNSVAAMDESGGTLSLSAQVENGWVHVRVTDTGVGIPDKIKPQIFDPFFTTKKVGEGTGLGLSLCYGIVKKYGGKISFTSSSREDQPDRPSGTAFTVSLPVLASGEAAEGEAG